MGSIYLPFVRNCIRILRILSKNLSLARAFGHRSWGPSKSEIKVTIVYFHSNQVLQRFPEARIPQLTERPSPFPTNEKKSTCIVLSRYWWLTFSFSFFLAGRFTYPRRRGLLRSEDSTSFRENSGNEVGKDGCYQEVPTRVVELLKVYSPCRWWIP